MTSSDLGMNIAKFRRQAGLSQSELGKCLNVSAQAVSRWERGGVPDAALLPQIASSLGCSLDDLYGLSTIPPKNVENTLAQEIQNTPSEQRTARAVQLAGHMMKTRGSLASDNPGALLAAAVACENAVLNSDLNSGRVPTNCYFNFLDGLMQASVASKFKYVLMMQEPKDGFLSALKELRDYETLFTMLGKESRLAVYLLGFSLPYGRNFTRDYICKKLELSDKLGQEILDELCSYGMLNRISIQISDECVDAYAVQAIPVIIPVLYFAGELIRDGSSYSLCAPIRSSPLLRETAVREGASARAASPAGKGQPPTQPRLCHLGSKSQENGG